MLQPASLKNRVALFSVLWGFLLVLTISALSYGIGKNYIREARFHYLYDMVGRVCADLDARLLWRQHLLVQAAKQITPQQGLAEPESARLIGTLQYLKGPFNSVVLYGRDGSILADYPTLSSLHGMNIADRDYFRETRQSLRPQITGPVQTRGQLQRNIIIFTVPLKDANGHFAGMLGATLELSSPEFFSELKTIHLGQTGYITVNSAHTMVNIYHPDRSRIMHPVPPAYKSPALHRAINGWEGVTEAEISTGEAMLVAYRHMHSVDWVVGGLLPRDEAYASLHHLTVTLVMGGVLLLILILPLTWWWMRRLLTPLDTLKEQVASLQHAPAQLPLRISGAAELQAVAESVSKVFVEREDFAQRLAEREVFFRTLNEDSPFGIFVIEADGHINYINRAAAQLAPPGGERDWVGCHWLDLVHVEERNGLAQSWRESVILNGRFRTQCRLSHREGGDALVELHFSPLLNGEREQSLVIMLDVTEREEAKSALLAERERAMAILASIADAVVLTNEHDEVMFLNMPAEAMLGVAASEAHGQPLAEFASFAEPDGAAVPVLCPLEALRGRRQVELELLTRGARLLSIELTLSEVSSAGSMHGYRVYVLHDDAERRQREQAHRWEASHDPLTGLANRRGFLAALNQLLSRPDRQDEPHAVAMLDLDFFKEVNDRAGHSAGDRLLQDIASLLLHRLRASDVVARLGGDEFAFILYDCDREHAADLLEGVRQQIAEHVMVCDSHPYHVTASIGIALLQAADKLPQDVLDRADMRCYLAKHQGRNRLVTMA